MIGRFAPRLFGRHIQGRARHKPGARELDVVDYAGQAKIVSLTCPAWSPAEYCPA